MGEPAREETLTPQLSPGGLLVYDVCKPRGKSISFGYESKLRRKYIKLLAWWHSPGLRGRIDCQCTALRAWNRADFVCEHSSRGVVAQTSCYMRHVQSQPHKHLGYTHVWTRVKMQMGFRSQSPRETGTERSILHMCTSNMQSTTSAKIYAGTYKQFHENGFRRMSCMSALRLEV